MKMTPLWALLAASAAALVSSALGAPPPEQGTKDSVSFHLRLKPYKDAKTGEEHSVDAAALAETQDMLRRRLSSDGIAKVEFTPEPPDRLTLRCGGLAPGQADTIRKAVVHVANLDFRTVHGDSDTLLPQIEAKKIIRDPAWVILPMKDLQAGEKEPRRLLVKRVPEITGDEIQSAYAALDTSGWGVGIRFTKEAGEKFFEITKNMRVAVDRFAIVLDGKILSAPTIQVAGGIMGGGCLITGKFTEKEVCGLVAALMNPLRHPVVIEEESIK